MRHLKQTTFIFILHGILAILGGCTAEDETDRGNGAGSEPLSIRVTASRFDGLAAPEKPLTRTPVEDGNTTTFSNYDVIGIFAIRNGAIVDGINNTRLTYYSSEDSWKPSSEYTKLYWHEGVSYVAYRPYKSNITIDASKTTKEIIASLAANSLLQPSTAQSSSPPGRTDNYSASDLMTASGTATTDDNKTLTLNFEHQFALLILEPQVYMPCTAPADGGFVYRAGSKAPATDPNVKSATINSVSACLMSDGTYRVLVKPTTSGSQITGSYLTSTDNKKVSFNGSSIATGFAAGHCYTVKVVRSTPNTTNSAERALATGDFVFHGASGIEVYPGNGLLESGKIPDSKDAVGMVITLASSGRMTDSGLNSSWNHAYVMGLENCSDDKQEWGPHGVKDVLPNMSISNGAANDMNGYTETEAMLTERANQGDLSSYGIFNAINTYRTHNPVPGGLSSARSPWFVPSIGQWWDVLINICGQSPETFDMEDDYTWYRHGEETDIWDSINSQLNKVGKPLTLDSGGTSSTGDHVTFWLSSEGLPKYSWCTYWTHSGKSTLLVVTIKDAEGYVRPFFAF